MAMAAGPKGAVKAEINVTPLVDVVLVLLIIFMEVTPLMRRGRDVTLPRVAPAVKRPAPEPVVLSVTGGGDLFVEQERCEDAAQMRDRLREAFSARSSHRVLLKADESLSYESVRRVMGSAKAAGAEKIALAVAETAQR